MGSVWQSADPGFNAPWGVNSTTGVNSTGMVQNLGGTLYGLFPDEQGAYDHVGGYVWESTDDGKNWTKLNNTSLDDYIGKNTSRHCTMVVSGTDLIFCRYDFGVNDALDAAKFSVTTDTWTDLSEHGIDINPSGSVDTYFVIDSVTDGTTMYVNNIYGREKIMGQSYARCQYSSLTISSMSWGSDVIWDETGSQWHQTAGPIVLDADGDVHTVFQDKWNEFSAPPAIWQHYEDDGSIQGPHEIVDFEETWLDPPTLDFQTIQSTDTLIVMGWGQTGFNVPWVWFSTNDGASWSPDAKMSDYTIEEPGYAHGIGILKDDDDNLILIWTTSSGGQTGEVWIWERAAAGGWTTPSLLVGTDNYLPGFGCAIAWSDEPNGLYFFACPGWHPDGFGTEELVYGVALGGALTHTKSHTLDMKTTIIGVNADFYIPSGVTAANVSAPNWQSSATWGISVEDPKTFVMRQWQSPDPHNEGYTFSQAGDGVWTFSEDIVAYDVSKDSGAVAVQLVNGEIYIGQYWFGWNLAESDFFNSWAFNNQRFDNGPHMQPRLVAPAPATVHDHPGVRLNSQKTKTATSFVWHHNYCISNYEKINGVNKVAIHLATADEDFDRVWGDGDASTNPATIGTHGFYNNPPVLLDPTHTTFDERIVGIKAYGQTGGWPLSETNPTGSFAKGFPGTFYWTREEASNTYMYGKEISVTGRGATSNRRVHIGGQRIWTNATSGNFTLNYPSDRWNVESATIEWDATAAEVETAILGMDPITSVEEVSGAGTESDPWIIELLQVNAGGAGFTIENYNYFYEGTTNTLSGGGMTFGGLHLIDPEVVKIVEVKHETVPNMGHFEDVWTSYANSPPFGSSGAGTSADVLKLYMTALDGKLSIMRPSWEGRGGTSLAGFLPWSNLHWEFMGESVSDGDVAHRNGITQAIGWVRMLPAQTAEHDSPLAFDGRDHTGIEYNMVLYIDDATKDIKAIASAKYATRFPGLGDAPGGAVFPFPQPPAV